MQLREEGARWLHYRFVPLNSHSIPFPFTHCAFDLVNRPRRRRILVVCKPYWPSCSSPSKPTQVRLLYYIYIAFSYLYFMYVMCVVSSVCDVCYVYIIYPPPSRSTWSTDTAACFTSNPHSNFIIPRRLTFHFPQFRLSLCVAVPGVPEELSSRYCAASPEWADSLLCT